MLLNGLHFFHLLKGGERELGMYLDGGVYQKRYVHKGEDVEANVEKSAW